MTEFWDNRYKASEFAYGTSPNQFFRDSIENYKLTGSIILPAEGEGRNAVFAAEKDLDVFAFDSSAEGKKKAENLALQRNVSIRYDLVDWCALPAQPASFDNAAFIFAHIPLSQQRANHKKVAEMVKPGGILLFEAFSTSHLELRQRNPKIGGPGKIEMLFAKSDIATDFANFEFLHFQEIEVDLQEGSFHKGIGKVIRLVGRKYSMKPSTLL